MERNGFNEGKKDKGRLYELCDTKYVYEGPAQKGSSPAEKAGSVGQTGERRTDRNGSQGGGYRFHQSM